MVKKEIAFYYDFGSPNAYLMHEVLKEINYHPMLLGGVFKATNNQSPMTAFANVAGKLDYHRRETARFTRRYGIDFKMNPHFPTMTIGIMRGAIHAADQDWALRYIEAVFAAMWCNEENMGDADVIARVLEEADLPAAEILAATQTPEVIQALNKATEEAVGRGVFGAPTAFVGDAMFFGKDSLDDLDWYLAQS